MGWIVLIIVAAVVVAGVVIKLCVNSGDDTSQEQLLERIEKGSDICIIDVRSAREYDSGHVPGATNIGHKAIAAHLDTLAPYKDKDVVVYCELGVRARMAQKTLSKAGFLHVYHLAGDMDRWRTAGLSMDKPGAETTEQIR